MLSGGRGKMGEEVRELRSTNRQLQNSHGDVKYSIGNGGAKELIHVTHGHEPVSYTHLTLPTRSIKCRSRWSPYH